MNISKKAITIHELLVKGNIHIAFFSETGDVDIQFQKKIFPGYTWEGRYSKEGRGIGWVILDCIKSNVKVMFHSDRISKMTVTNQEEVVEIFGIYGVLNGKTTFWQQFKNISKTKCPNQIIIGDLNLHLANPLYVKEKEYLKSWVVLSDNTPTRISGLLQTAIDHTLSKQNFVWRHKEHILIPFLKEISPDHRAIIDCFDIEMQLPDIRIPIYKRPKIIVTHTKEHIESFQEKIVSWNSDNPYDNNIDKAMYLAAKEEWRKIKIPVPNPFKKHASKEEQDIQYKINEISSCLLSICRYQNDNLVTTLKYHINKANLLEKNWEIHLEEFENPELASEKEIQNRKRELRKLYHTNRNELEKMHQQVSSSTLMKRIEKIQKSHKMDPRAFFTMANPNYAEHKYYLMRAKKSDSTYTSTPEELKEEIFTFYSDLFSEKVEEKGKWKERAFTTKKFELPKMSLQDLDNIIKYLPKKKSPGPDMITYEIIKLLPLVGREKLLQKLNDCIETQTIPQNWSESETTLLFKTGDTSQINNYRPIALLNTCYKILAFHIQYHLSRFMEENKLLSDDQFGFRKKRDTTEAIGRLKITFEKLSRHKSPYHLLFLDITKAYDTVPIWGLKHALQLHGCESLIPLIESIYNNSSTRILTMYGLTQKIQCKRGVKQGCPLSPILFNIFINPLLLELEKKNQKFNHTWFQFFADDGIVVSKYIDNTQKLLDTIDSFMTHHGMSLGLSKSKTAVLQSSDEPLTLKSENRIIPSLQKEETYRYLGIQIGLKSEENNSNQCIKIIDTFIGYLKRKCFTAHQTVEIINKVIWPAIQYKLIWINSDYTVIKYLENTVRKILSFKLKTGGYDSIKHYQKSRRNGGMGLTNFVYKLTEARYRAFFIKGIENQKKEISVLWEEEFKRSNSLISNLKLQMHSVDVTITRTVWSQYHINSILPPHLIQLWPYKPGIDIDIFRLTCQPNENFFKESAHRLHPNTAWNIFENAAMNLNFWLEQVKERSTGRFDPDTHRKHNDYIAVYTDGSYKNCIAQCAVFFSHEFKLTITIPGYDNAYIAELVAIKLALILAPKEEKLIIYSDSKAAIAAIMKALSKDPDHTVEYWWMLLEIVKQFKQRTQDTKIEHVYSHLLDYPETADKREKRELMYAKYQEYAMEIMKGNKLADAEATKEIDQSNVNMIGLFSSAFQEKTHMLVYKLTNYPLSSLKSVFKKSTEYFGRLKHGVPIFFSEKLQSFIFKLYHHKLPFHERLHQFSKFFPSACPLGCENDESWKHFLHCQKLQPIWNQLKTKIKQILHQYKIENYNWQSEDQITNEIMLTLETPESWIGEFALEGIKIHKKTRIALTIELVNCIYQRWKERCKKKYQIPKIKRKWPTKYERKLFWNNSSDLPQDRIIIRTNHKNTNS
jgi:hypothetical protein